jgi:hypothetical protein
VAAIWDRPLVVTGGAGAAVGVAVGAALAGVSALCKAEGWRCDVSEFASTLMGRGKVTRPLPEDVADFHRPGGYLDRFSVVEARLIGDTASA